MTTYYTIIKNNHIVDVNSIFLKWHKKHNMFLVCDPKDAHYIQSSDHSALYQVPWLNLLPEGAPQFEMVQSEIIDKNRYDMIYNKLLENQVLTVEIQKVDINEDIKDDFDELIEDETPVISMANLYAKMMELENKCNELTVKNEALENYIKTLNGGE